jgi:hypothetical protein
MNAFNFLVENWVAITGVIGLATLYLPENIRQLLPAFLQPKPKPPVTPPTPGPYPYMPPVPVPAPLTPAPVPAPQPDPQDKMIVVDDTIMFAVRSQTFVIRYFEAVGNKKGEELARQAAQAIFNPVTTIDA